MSLHHSLNNSVFEMIRLTEANPAVATNFSHTVAANTRILPVTIQYTLTTDANAANRIPNIAFNFAPTGILIFSSGNIITASLTALITFAVGIGVDYQNSANKNITSSLPLDFWINPGAAVASIITNIQAGDQISDIQLYFARQIVE